MENFKINRKLLALSKEIEKSLEHKFEEIEEIAKYNENKVLKSFIDCKISSANFVETSGYGYYDSGRENLDRLYSKIFGSKDAFVRFSFVSGTHTISVALFSLLKKGDKMLSITGTPYETISETIGIKKNENSLQSNGVIYKEIDIFKQNKIDLNLLLKELKNEKFKIIYIQRSKGYSFRKSIDISEIEKIAKLVHKIDKSTIIFVDNCYGEFVEKKEPNEVGANIVCGSLIKNPGGAIAKSGGYIAGDKKLIELCAQRFTAPGLGREIGCNLNQNKDIFLGIYLAPMFVCNALKSSIFTRAIFESLNFKIFPQVFEKTSDIVSILQLNSKERLESFCEGIQQNSPIDSFFKPIPTKMPGYENEVIMACGSFVSGASLELSADAEIKPPFNIFIQGGISYNNSKFTILKTIEKMGKENLLQF